MSSDDEQPPIPPNQPPLPPNQNNPPPRPPAGDGPNNEIAAATVGIRLPWPRMVENNIELWFTQVDHWFGASRITSDATKHSTIVAALDASLLQQIYATVMNPPPPPASKYEAVKAALIRNFTESEQRRAQQFVSGLQLGDRKPSHLLNDLRRVGGEGQDEKLLKVLWLNRLPVQVQTCLAAVTSPLDALAELADSVMETFRVSESFGVNAVQNDVARPSTSTVAAASSNSAATNNAVKNSDSDALSKLSAQVEKLTRQMARIHNENVAGIRSRPRERSLSRPRSRNATPANVNEPEDDGRCWYHRTYGNDARKCREPCNVPKN